MVRLLWKLRLPAWGRKKERKKNLMFIIFIINESRFHLTTSYDLIACFLKTRLNLWHTVVLRRVRVWLNWLRYCLVAKGTVNSWSFSSLLCMEVVWADCWGSRPVFTPQGNDSCHVLCVDNRKPKPECSWRCFTHVLGKEQRFGRRFYLHHQVKIWTLISST